MDLELKIENFGPIDKATIQVGQFTVFAGPNSTGKTFVAKMLYSMLGARKANHARVFFADGNQHHRIGICNFLGSAVERGKNAPCPKLERDSKRSTLSYGRRSQVIQSKMNLTGSRRFNPN